MTSRREIGEGAKSQLATSVATKQRKRFDQNYGAMTMVMGYLPTIEQLKLQGLDTWQYNTGVGRAQVRLVWPEMFYLTDHRRPQILAANQTGEFQQFDFRGESDFSNAGWLGVQFGLSHLFQFKDGFYRILKMDPSQRSFTVERSWALPEKLYVQCLTNFYDQFIFLFGENQSTRYSLVEDRWEELPPHSSPRVISACSLRDKVYVFTRDLVQLIHVLHNPGASISSQELHWQVIAVPEDIVAMRAYATFVPLNLTEIAILGGKYFFGTRSIGDVITFNTSTCEFKKEMEDETNLFKCHDNQKAKVCENTIIALAEDQNLQMCLIKYKKGDTCFTSLKL